MFQYVWQRPNLSWSWLKFRIRRSALCCQESFNYRSLFLSLWVMRSCAWFVHDGSVVEWKLDGNISICKHRINCRHGTFQFMCRKSKLNITAKKHAAYTRMLSWIKCCFPFSKYFGALNEGFLGGLGHFLSIVSKREMDFPWFSRIADAMYLLSTGFTMLDTNPWFAVWWLYRS